MTLPQWAVIAGAVYFLGLGLFGSLLYWADGESEDTQFATIGLTVGWPLALAFGVIMFLRYVLLEWLERRRTAAPRAAMTGRLLCRLGVHRLEGRRQFWLHQIYADGHTDHVPSLWIQEWRCVRCDGVKWG